MNATIKKWGNSLGLRIPNKIAKYIGVQDGSLVLIEEKKGGIYIKKLEKKEESLDDIIEKITEENKHNVISFESPIGKEVW